MRKPLGIAVILVAGVGLSLWGRAAHAPRMQDAISADMSQIVASALHDVEWQVSGRDITLAGLADTAAERDALIAAANAVTGRRVVNADGLSVLPEGNPHTTTLTWDGTTLSADGQAPSARARAGLATALGGAGTGLTLASGAAADWADYLGAGAAALAPLDDGQAVLTGDRLVVGGTALGPAERDAALAALAGLDAGRLETAIAMRDDGTPARFTFDWGAGSGAALAGKLPPAMTPEAIAQALGVAVPAEIRQGLLGDAGDMGIWARLRDMLPLVESLRLTYGPEGVSVLAGLAKGIGLDGARAQLAALLGDAATLEVTAAEPGAEDGAERIHALTGQRERLSGGYWLAVPDFTPDAPTCTEQANAILGDNAITFVTGSADLDASALAALNRLGSILRECTTTGGLRAEIGGHTDSVGDDESNRRLSQLRASAVRVALIERGADRGALSSRGYGESQPIADNGTEEGRALNRRTTIIWSE